MADEKISALTSAGALAGTEPLPIVQGGVTKKTTVQDVANLKATPNLQQVTNVGFTTTTKIASSNGAGSETVLNNGNIDIATGDETVTIEASLVTYAYNAQLPDKLTSPQTFAMLSDITSGGGIPHATAAGVDTYTATVSGVTAYNDGDAYLIRFTNGNTDAATLNISGVGAVTLYRNNDGQLIGGDIWDGGEMLCTYNSTSGGFQCIGTSPNSLFAYVVNADSVAITRGQPVYAFGSTGNRMSVKLAYNTTDATSAQTYGLVYSTSIAAGQKGIIIIQGVLDGLNLGGTWADGDPVYLGTTAGTITKTKQYAPNHLVYLGVVERANAGNGIMYVRVQNGYEMDELHNVSAQTPANKDGLFYNTSTSLWESRQVAATDINANVSNTEFGYLDGVTSSIQTQLNAKGTIFSTTTDGAVTVSSTSNVYTSGILIPANSFTVGNNVEVTVRGRKTGTAGNMTMRIYVNTTNDISGTPILVATNTTAAGNQTYLQFGRFLSIKSGSTEVFSNTGGSITDWLSSNLGVNGLSIDWTNDLYIVVSTQCTIATDSANARSSFIKIKN